MKTDKTLIITVVGEGGGVGRLDSSVLRLTLVWLLFYVREESQLNKFWRLPYTWKDRRQAQSELAITEETKKIQSVSPILLIMNKWSDNYDFDSLIKCAKSYIQGDKCGRGHCFCWLFNENCATGLGRWRIHILSQLYRVKLNLPKKVLRNSSSKLSYLKEISTAYQQLPFFKRSGGNPIK